jgi:hypothetical protein
MEFHNEKLLPRGLPEIIAQFIPSDIYAFTKVITYPRKASPFWYGEAGWEGMTQSYNIRLYPTTICYNPHAYYISPGTGTYSFRLWYALLHVALHEVGHLVTRELYQAV